MQVFFKKLAQHRSHLSQLEKQVLEHILSKPEQVKSMNVQELAKEIFVSTATISRTCQQLGFQGYQDLKFALNQYTLPEKKDCQTSKSELLSSHIERMQNEMNHTCMHLQEKDIKAAADLLKNSNQTELIGVGISYPVCVDAKRKLLFSGKLCNAREDIDELRSISNQLTPNDVAIIVSYSGETLHILEFAHTLKNRGVPIISITGNHQNLLRQISTISLQAHVTNCYFGELDMSSRFPLSILLDLLILSYLNNS
ncbi:MurR/RpiR family transcriptional regulator [Bacillus sp. 1P06AnD]|uniref:MurR/RpiR family transcriptional regulator n=1 Tax=Bacillus sp. 1P06AnD TaxID=3132208 RepID=UPI00399FC307